MGTIESFPRQNSETTQSFGGLISDSFEQDSVAATEEDYLFDATSFDVTKEKPWLSRFFSATGSVLNRYILQLRKDAFAILLIAIAATAFLNYSPVRVPIAAQLVQSSNVFIVLLSVLTIAAIFGLALRFGELSSLFRRELRRRESLPRVSVVSWEVWLGKEKIKFFLHPDGLVAKRSNNGFVLFLDKKWIGDVADYTEDNDRWTSKYAPVPGLQIDIRPARENWRNETRLYIPNHFFVDKALYAQSPNSAKRQAAELQAKFKKALSPTVIVVKEANN